MVNRNGSYCVMAEAADLANRSMIIVLLNTFISPSGWFSLSLITQKARATVLCVRLNASCYAETPWER